jgi:hypothetical protein
VNIPSSLKEQFLAPSDEKWAAFERGAHQVVDPSVKVPVDRDVAPEAT